MVQSDGTAMDIPVPLLETAIQTYSPGAKPSSTQAFSEPKLMFSSDEELPPLSMDSRRNASQVEDSLLHGDRVHADSL